MVKNKTVKLHKKLWERITGYKARHNLKRLDMVVDRAMKALEEQEADTGRNQEECR